MEPAPEATPAPELARSRRRVWAARGLAAAADALQLVLFPLFGEGFASPAEVVLDGAMALLLTRLVGFHWSYLPSAAIELIPGADLAPTWTAAAFLATGTFPRARKAIWIGIAFAALAIAVAAALLWRTKTQPP